MKWFGKKGEKDLLKVAMEDQKAEKIATAQEEKATAQEEDTSQENESTQPKAEDPSLSKKKGALIGASEFTYFLGKDETLKHLKTIALVFGLLILYIFNTHQAIKMNRECEVLSKEIKEYHADYISIKSEFMHRSKQSQVAKRLEASGIKELEQPPIRIEYERRKYDR